MTHSLESAKQLYEEVKSSPGFFAVSYHFWFKPEVQRFLKERDKFGTIKSFQFISSEELEVEKGWILDHTQGGPWLDWAANALSVLRPVLCGDEVFQSFSVMDVRYVFSKKYEIELKADIDIKLDGIDGNISVDWLSPKGGFIAKTVLHNDRDDEIILDHALGHILINSQLYWSGEDLRYLDVYEDFYNRLNSNRANIETGMQDAEIIQAVRDYKGWTAEMISLVDR
jgi:predicted dehydrogenase